MDKELRKDLEQLYSIVFAMIRALEQKNILTLDEITTEQVMGLKSNERWLNIK